MTTGPGINLTQTGSRCLACGLPITREQQVFRIRGLVVHLRCAVYRRRRLKAAAFR